MGERPVVEDNHEADQMQASGRAAHGMSDGVNSSDCQLPVRNVYINKPLGYLAPVALICGLAGAVVAMVLDLTHVFDFITDGIQVIYTSKPFYLEDSETGLKLWSWLAAFLFAWAVAYVVLDSAGKGKRVFIGLLVLLLISMFSPVMMLWGVLWIPVVEIVAVTFALLCTLIYTSQHIMPCELGVQMKQVKQVGQSRAVKKRNKKRPLPLMKSCLVRMLKTLLKKKRNGESDTSGKDEPIAPVFRSFDKDNTSTNPVEK